MQILFYPVVKLFVMENTFRFLGSQLWSKLSKNKINVVHSINFLEKAVVTGITHTQFWWMYIAASIIYKLYKDCWSDAVELMYSVRGRKVYLRGYVWILYVVISSSQLAEYWDEINLVCSWLCTWRKSSRRFLVMQFDLKEERIMWRKSNERRLHWITMKFYIALALFTSVYKVSRVGKVSQ